MGQFMKPGRICVLTAGRHAGKKAIIVKHHEVKAGNRKFPNALVAGIERYPRRLTRKRASKKRIKQRTQIKPFLKAVNYTHMLPTRYVVKDFEFDGINDASLKDKETRKEAKKTIKELFENIVSFLQYMFCKHPGKVLFRHHHLSIPVDLFSLL